MVLYSTSEAEEGEEDEKEEESEEEVLDEEWEGESGGWSCDV